MGGQAFEKPRPAKTPVVAERNGEAPCCANCEHSRGSAEAGLRCAKGPPQVYVNHGVVAASFPPVSASWRCGEWKGKT